MGISFDPELGGLITGPHIPNWILRLKDVQLQLKAQRSSKFLWRRDRLPTPVFLGFPVAQLVKNLPAMRDTWVRSLGREDPLEDNLLQYSCLENSMGR